MVYRGLSKNAHGDRVDPAGPDQNTSLLQEPVNEDSFDH
jgi:hypothetical protein